MCTDQQESLDSGSLVKNDSSVKSNASVIPIYNPSGPYSPNTLQTQYGSIDIPSEVTDLESGVENPCLCPANNPLGSFCQPLTDILVTFYYEYPRAFVLSILICIVVFCVYSLNTGNYFDLKWLLMWLSCIFMKYCYK
ncbi:hypothetical protein ACO0R3_000194 [Hanseniaspora guilliermondii]